MRIVDIHFQNRRLLPGDILAGVVEIKTNKPFGCNRVVLKLKGKEHTEYSAGENRVSDDKTIIGRVFRVSEGKTIPEGITRIPFSIDLPKQLSPTYEGTYGRIEYTLEAVVEVNWTLDPKCKKEFRVLQNRPPYIEDSIGLEPSTITDDELQVQLDEKCLRLDTGINVQFKVKERSRVRGVRFEIIREEDAVCRSRTLNRKSAIVRKIYPIASDDFGRWLDINIGEKWRYHLPFLSGLFKITYFLKVTLDVGLDFDPSIEFPLKFSDIVPERDVLEEIAIDLGFREW
ncbi:hypothetical protein EU527_09005 [Candidatus Thorarchaeota archaeon]|nr:MAG: hypothetical protein EU527_09005 [Candidatus Thorarchaeota archaeon]